MTNERPPQSKRVTQVLTSLMLLALPELSYGGLQIQSPLFTAEISSAGEFSTTKSSTDINVSGSVRAVAAGLSSVTIDIRNKSNVQISLPLTMIVGTDIKPFFDPGGGYQH